MATERDLYALLGVSKTASNDELRKAYRKLARTYHPDVNEGNKSSEERFKEVSSAYDILGDPAKRKLYDEFGEVGVREGFDPAQARAYQNWNRGDRQQRSSGPFRGAGPFGGGAAGGQPDFDVGDIFGDFFGGRRGARVRRGRDIVATVEIDFAQALRGCEVQLQMPSQAACGVCGGRGSDCPACAGSGRVASTERLTVRIPPGADQGSRLKVAGRGEPAAGGGTPGDLLIETHIRPHAFFRRDGLDIYLRLPVTLDEAYNGATVSVPTPQGQVNLRVPAHSQQGTRLRLRGQGVQRAKKAGDLYVELEIRLPDADDLVLAEALRQAVYKSPVRQDVLL